MREDLLKNLNEKEFVEKLMILETTEEVKKLFSDSGASINDEEIEELKSIFKVIVQKLKELPEEELNKIAAAGLGSIQMKAEEIWNDWSQGVNTHVVENLARKEGFDGASNRISNLIGTRSGEAFYKMSRPNAEIVGETIKYGVPIIAVTAVLGVASYAIAKGTKIICKWANS